MSLSLANQCQSYGVHHLVLIVLESTFLELDLRTCQKLRVFEARIETSSHTFSSLISWLTEVLSTITSPVFSKFILSLDDTTLEPHVLRINDATTRILDQWVSCRPGMRFIIKGHSSLNWRQLLALCFPSSTAAGAFDFAD